MVSDEDIAVTRILSNLDALPPDQRDRALELIYKVAGGEGPGDFISRVWPRQPPPDHIQPILDAIDRARFRPQRVLISMPPRHAKTTTIERLLSWWLLRYPADTCAYISYNDHKAWKHSRNIRSTCRSIGVPMGGDMSVRHEGGARRGDIAGAVGEWRTAFGGGLLAAGARGGITGHGVQGLMVYDDPYKNREEAESEAVNERVVDQFFEVVYTRLEGASVFVIHTRWSPTDLIGQLAAKGGWTVIRLPAMAEADDILGRPLGAALWPQFYPLNRSVGGPDAKEYLEEIRRNLGEWRFAALYQQQPQPQGEPVFREPKWYDPGAFRIEGWTVHLGGDPAATDDTRGDHSVAVAIASKRLPFPPGWNKPTLFPLRDGRILDVIRGRWTVPEFARRAVAFQKKWFGAAMAMEAVAGFKAVPQIMREIEPNLRVTEVTPSVSKFTRSQAFAAAWNDDRILVPLGQPWTGAYVKEHCAFTGVDGQEDDQVDASAHGWNAGAEASEGRRGSSVQERWR